MKSSNQDMFSLIAQYENEITEAVGMPLSIVRFAASFLVSVVVGLLLKFVPTVRGGTCASSAISDYLGPCSSSILHALHIVYRSLVKQ